MSPYDDGWLASCAQEVGWVNIVGMKPTFEQEKLACAEAAHEMNRIYCQTIGDFSQVSWGVAEDWQRSSAINGVEGVFAGDGPEQSHEVWCKEKLDAGWKYGPVKDPAKKEHHCLVPYNKLPPEQRHKDFLFVSTVHHMAAVLGHPVPHAVPDIHDHGLQVGADRFSVTTRPA